MADVEIFDQRFETVVGYHEMLKQLGSGFTFLEGPVWHVDRGVLIFSDIPENSMYTYDPRTEQFDRYRYPSNKGNGNVFDKEHRLITCEHATSRVVREEHDGSMTVLASHYDDIELNSPNDVAIDPAGRVYFSDPPYGRLAGPGLARPQLQPCQGVYRVDPADGIVVRLADDFDRPNGLCFADNGRVLYVNDSARMHIRRFEVDGDRLRGGDVFAEVHGTGPGAPDGMKVDSEGNVYCCGPGGLHVYDPKGIKLGVLRTPEEVCNFEFGDNDRRTVYMTASTGLYSFRVRVPGPAIW